MAIQLYKQPDGSWGSIPSSVDSTGRQLVPGQDNVVYGGPGVGYTTDKTKAVSQAGLDPLNGVKNLAAKAYAAVKGVVAPALNGPPTNRLQEAGAQGVSDAGTFRALNPAAGEGALATSYQDTISGKNPSVAEEELHQQTAQNASQQLGFASGLGGLNAALARRTAAENIGRQNQAAVGQQQMLRAKEITDAQTGLGNVYGTEAKQQMTEQELAEKAYKDQLDIQSGNRAQNIQIGGAVASGLGAGAS